MSKKLLYDLVKPGERLPWIKELLISKIWTIDNYESLSPVEYLKLGEMEINRFEELISSAADRIYQELISSPETTKKILEFLSKDTVIVVFDGLSLREIPIILKLASESGFTIKGIDYSLAAVPSETLEFIQREFPCGKVSPSQLPKRSEMKNNGISVIYTNNIAHQLKIPSEETILLWSAFPDNTYTDSGSKFENHFENIHIQFETAWINTVQQIKGKKQIIVTSDHGYIFFGTGMDANRTTVELRDLNKYFGNNRNVKLSANPNPPESDDLIVDEKKGVAIIKGRVKTRATGEAASRLYKHGGISLMEMMTPWITLEK